MSEKVQTPETKEFDVLTDIPIFVPKKQVEKKNYNTKQYYCLRCRQRFNKTANFKRHISKSTPPAGTCLNIDTDIYWKLVQENGLEQIKYYKKNKEFIYNKQPTDADVQRAQEKTNTYVHHVLKYMNGNTDNANSQGILEKYLAKKKEWAIKFLELNI